MVNRVSSYFQKGGHSATETELKKYEHTKGETSPKLWHQKQATENHNKSTACQLDRHVCRRARSTAVLVILVIGFQSLRAQGIISM